jgi:hypothetical protein
MHFDAYAGVIRVNFANVGYSHILCATHRIEHMEVNVCHISVLVTHTDKCG